METDLREFLADLALNEGSLELLPPDVRQSASQRFELDNRSRGVRPESDVDLLEYTDFADLGKMLRLRADQAKAACGKDVLGLADAIERMAPARNRVCHSRPLEEDDLPAFFDLAALLLAEFPKVGWKNLQNIDQQIKQDPSFVFRLTIPAYWRTVRESVHHNLPVPDFDETGFIGRVSERRDVLKHVLGPHPVITIVGEGGVGKSALAVRCLYDLLDGDVEQKYEAIIWVSLKTKILTPIGVQEIRDSVITTLGIVQAATEALGAPTQVADMESLLKELQDYLQRLRILLIIDNLETVSTETLRPLLGAVPQGSKILITSRVGLGEIELRYKLDPLDKKQSVSLARRYAKSLNLQVLSAASDDRLDRYCRLLYYNPLLIKWFVSSVASGADPERLIARGNQAFSSALQFCFENLFNRLSETQRELLHILASARRQLTQAELFFLLQETTSLGQSELEASLSALHNSSMLKRTLVEPRRADSGTQVALTDVASEYIARFAPPPPKTFERVQSALKKLREMTEKSAVLEAVYKYEIFAVRSSNRDERIAAVYLNSALQEMRGDKLHEARKMVARAKSLMPTFPEVYRVSALVESRGNDIYKAAEEIETAIELDPTSPLARYQYALFLMNEMDDSQQALTQIDMALAADKGDKTLETGRALALTRLGRCKEAAGIYEGVLETVGDRPRKWRITTRDQAAECYRRWAEQDKDMLDEPALRGHLDRAIDILEIGLGCGDFDSRMAKLYINIIEDGLQASMRFEDFEYARALLSRVRQASYAADFPPFRIVTFEGFEAAFNQDLKSLSAQEISDCQMIQWAPVESFPAMTVTQVNTLLEGRVKSVSPGSRFGFIVDGLGQDWFFHQNGLANREDWKKMTDGQRVRFKEGVNKLGRCAMEVQPVS